MPLWNLEIGQDYDEGLVEELLGAEYLLGRAPMSRGLMARGGVRRGMRAARPSGSTMARAVAAKRASEGVLVETKVPTKGRGLFMGLDSAANIAAAATAVVTDRPQKLFRPERLAVPASIAPLFVMNSLNIGTVNQFVSNTAVPCETFQEGGVGVGLKGDTATPGIDISASVTNISGGAARFRATIFGSAVE